MIFFSILGKFGAAFASIPFPIYAALHCVLFGLVDLMLSLGIIPDDYVDNYLATIDEYLMNSDPNPYYSALPGEDCSPGIFSAFMVADRVVITSTTKVYQVAAHKKQRDHYVWDGRASDGFFRLARVDPKAEDRLMKRGTKVTLYLKKEYEKTYLDESKLRELVDKYTFDGPKLVA